ncbi:MULTISPECIES: glycosyltransferase family 4 protein [Halorussus]|uniref:glycosyltransferase family 4 protein n=1 Tax=Halorussus TaxID=1070314 RepID=UPI0013B38063|nr:MULTISPECIES: glycosyltransferase family 4 protein [Halorussus]NHN60112.1 glycosyltransferase family 4 protein [Halorussus sp. JP-T4]
MRIVFLSLNAYDMLTGGHGGNVGGSQLQQVLIGRELTDRGHEVYFIENDQEYKEETTVDGIDVILKDEYPNGSLPVRLPARTIATLRTLHALDPDVVYVRVPNLDIFPLSVYCSITDTRFVYNFAHDSEVTDDPVVLNTALTNNTLYWGAMQKALGTADALVAQNDFQYTRASNKYSKTDITLIWNGYPDPDQNPTSKQLSATRPQILWVAMLREWKQPELVLRLASEIPEADFIIVGGQAAESPEIYERVEQKASKLDNVCFEGFVSYDNVGKYFETSDIFVNTSIDEGFPNTFLQAWANRTPVVSLNVNPNDLLQTHDIGFCADGSTETMRKRLQELVQDEEYRHQLKINAYKHFVENHSIQQVANQYEAVFRGEAE